MITCKSIYREGIGRNLHPVWFRGTEIRCQWGRIKGKELARVNFASLALGIDRQRPLIINLNVAITYIISVISSPFTPAP
jgi:hypothetical protein